MSDVVKAIILGLVQGFTEFLPVSSSGHLKIFTYLGGQPLLHQEAFDVVVHFATLLVVMIVFYKKYFGVATDCITGVKSWHGGQGIQEVYTTNPGVKVAVFVVISSIPTAFFGLLLKDYMEQFSLNVVGPLLILTSVILLLPKFIKREERSLEQLTWKFALALGFAQSLAILPGVSRSGTTISIAIVLGASRSFSGYFSFLILIPAVLGAMILNLGDIVDLDAVIGLAGFFSAFLSGLFALTFLLKLLDKGRFFLFSPYCFIVGILVLLFCV
jgi:undecaprenyl-diphosphatase